MPLQWFIEHPFQNWTRSTSQLLGTVFLWVDYRLPLAPLEMSTTSWSAGSAAHAGARVTAPPSAKAVRSLRASTGSHRTRGGRRARPEAESKWAPVTSTYCPAQ